MAGMSHPLLPAIHHVAIISGNYARSKHFYTEILGFRIIREVYRDTRASYKLDLEVSPGVQLELFSFPSPPSRPSRPEAMGLRHLAFAVPDVQAVVSTLMARGVVCEPIRVDEFTGARFTFFADPDDLPIEVYEQLR